MKKNYEKTMKMNNIEYLLKHFDVRYSILSFADIVRLENEPEKSHYIREKNEEWKFGTSRKTPRFI